MDLDSFSGGRSTFGGGHHFPFLRYKHFVKAVLDFLDSLRTSKRDES